MSLALSEKEMMPDDLEGYLQEVQKLDQADGEHSRAAECYELLKNREADFIGSPLQDEYWNLVSIELFHIGQREALLQADQQTALLLLKKAKDAAQNVSPAFDNNDWMPYLNATEAYFESDTEKMTFNISQCTGNRHVIERLISGLKKYGKPDYKRDY